MPIVEDIMVAVGMEVAAMGVPITEVPAIAADIIIVATIPTLNKIGRYDKYEYCV